MTDMIKRLLTTYNHLLVEYQRYFLFVFWALVIFLVSTMGWGVLHTLGIDEGTELSLLSLKLHYRGAMDITTKRRLPSKDIVLIGIDKKTSAWLRQHSDWGTDRQTLSRDVQADILNYLTDQGAKAVIFDLEFKDSKPGDGRFIRAIRRNGHVYAANRMEDPLGIQLAAQNQDRPVSAEMPIYPDALFLAYHYPQWLYQAKLAHLFHTELAVLPPKLGGSFYYSLFLPVDPPLEVPPTGENLSENPRKTVSAAPMFWMLGINPWAFQAQMQQNVLRSNRFQPNSALMADLPLAPAPVPANLMENVLDRHCINDNYRDYYPKTPAFLKRLALEGINIDVPVPLLPETNEVITHCYTHPTVLPLMEALAGIGIPSVEYDHDAYLRHVNVIYRGYQGNYYPYLGLRPALDLLGVDRMTYIPPAKSSWLDPNPLGTLLIGSKKVPLMQQGQQVLINWRNPNFLLEQILRDHHLISRKSEPQWWHRDILMLNAEQGLQNTGHFLHLVSDADYARWVAKFQARTALLQKELGYWTKLDLYAPGDSNPWLGGGHLYRMVSAVDLIRYLRHDPTRNKHDRAWEYNIPGMPESGRFTFKDKIVFVGNTVADVHRTPMSNTTFGTEVVAAVTDMFLHDDQFVRKASPLVQWTIVALLAVAGAAAIISFENLSIGFTVGIILLILFWVLNFLAFVYNNQWFDFLVPSLLIGFGIVASMLYRYYIHDREKHHLTNVFSKYVSPQVMLEIMKNPEKALDNLRGGKKELTVMFADLQGFTQQFEHADPELMVSQLNTYFDVMTEIILANGGTYDKYMGDSIMAFFGAPTEMANHAEMACRAAMEMQQALKKLNDGWEKDGSGKTLFHGIGIASGEMFVGNFGSKNIKNFTVMGSNVNLGSRLEAFTRVARVPVIISDRTWTLARTHIRIRDLGQIQVKGFTEPVQIYGLEGLMQELLPAPVPSIGEFEGEDSQPA